MKHCHIFQEMYITSIILAHMSFFLVMTSPHSQEEKPCFSFTTHMLSITLPCWKIKQQFCRHLVKTFTVNVHFTQYLLTWSSDTCSR